MGIILKILGVAEVNGDREVGEEEEDREASRRKRRSLPPHPLPPPPRTATFSHSITKNHPLDPDLNAPIPRLLPKPPRHGKHPTTDPNPTNSLDQWPQTPGPHLPISSQKPTLAPASCSLSWENPTLWRTGPRRSCHFATS